MYAVITTGGKQYRIAEGEKIKVEKLLAEVGERVDFDQILMIGDGDNLQIGAPLLSDSKVTATVLSHGRGDKIKIVKFRRRKNSRRQAGHRQYFTEIQIDSISMGEKAEGEAHKVEGEAHKVEGEAHKAEAKQSEMHVSTEAESAKTKTREAGAQSTEAATQSGENSLSETEE